MDTQLGKRVGRINLKVQSWMKLDGMDMLRKKQVGWIGETNEMNKVGKQVG